MYWCFAGLIAVNRIVLSKSMMLELLYKTMNVCSPAIESNEKFVKFYRLGLIVGLQAIKNPAIKMAGFVNWWRRRGSNPRPSALRSRIYMLSFVY